MRDVGRRLCWAGHGLASGRGCRHLCPCPLGFPRSLLLLGLQCPPPLDPAEGPGAQGGAGGGGEGGGGYELEPLSGVDFFRSSHLPAGGDLRVRHVTWAFTHGRGPEGSRDLWAWASGDRAGDPHPPASSTRVPLCRRPVIGSPLSQSPALPPPILPSESGPGPRGQSGLDSQAGAHALAQGPVLKFFIILKSVWHFHFAPSPPPPAPNDAACRGPPRTPRAPGPSVCALAAPSASPRCPRAPAPCRPAVTFLAIR